MSAIYLIIALTILLSGFALGVLWSACRVAAIADHVADEALAEMMRREEERGV